MCVGRQFDYTSIHRNQKEYKIQPASKSVIDGDSQCVVTVPEFVWKVTDGIRVLLCT